MRSTTRAALAGSAALTCGAALLFGASAEASAAETAPLFIVKQEGLTADQGARLAGAFDLPNAIKADGGFGYVSPAFGQVPLQQAGEGKDESGRPTVSEAIDTTALKSLRPLSDQAALDRATRLLDAAPLSPALEPRPVVSNAELTLSDRAGETLSRHALDTTVSYRFQLGGLPVTGQGAKLRITFNPDGTVTQLSDTMRQLARGVDVPVIPVDEAQKQCAALYDDGVAQEQPTLGYVLPTLTAREASGVGKVKKIYPQYTCNPSTDKGAQVHRQVPAVPGSGPKAEVKASLAGGVVSGSAAVAGGRTPYTLRWSSSTTALGARGGTAVSYTQRSRLRGADETLSLEVTDANGLTTTANIDLGTGGEAGAQSVPGGGGFGKLSIDRLDVGIEQTVDEWQCAQDSAIGFKSVMSAHSVPTAFDWRGWSAWERDFKDVTLGGTDSTYVDNVDAQWYTGHGSPGGFTFKSSVTDTSIVPGDARWGNRDLEWLQLESCQVLADTSGTHDYFGRWGPTMDGLHMLNGFHTNAYCVGGGTGRAFADYLFPKQVWFWTRPALTVRNAWAQMALDKEPSGVVYRSMGNAGPGWVTNIGDHFWGQGSVGPDISKAGRIGMWSITGTV